jgi:hypothetical protein
VGRRKGWFLAVALLLVAACGGDDDGEVVTPVTSPVTTPPVVAETTTTTVGVDEIPDEITVEYVQRVMDALDESWGEMFRQYKADGGPTVDNHAWLAELYAEPAYGQMEQFLGGLAGGEFDDVRDDPDRPVTEVEQLLGASSNCLFVFGQRDFDPLFESPTEEGKDGLLQLIRKESTASERNPTAWTIARDVSTDRPEEVRDPCATDD